MEQIDTFNIGTENDITDMESDYYGNKLIIGTSTGKLILYENINGKMSKINEINAHIGPVFKVSWSHPKFNNLISSCGFDKKLIIYQLNINKNFEKLYEFEDSDSSLTTLSFSPSSKELIILAGSLNGNIFIIKYKNENFINDKIFAHDFGVNAICFLNENKFITSGNDNYIKIWEINKDNDKAQIINELHPNDEDILTRDLTVSDDTHFASCGEDGSIYYWTLNKENNTWTSNAIYQGETKLEKINFNQEHTVLCAIDEDGKEILITEEEFNK